MFPFQPPLLPGDSFMPGFWGRVLAPDLTTCTALAWSLPRATPVTAGTGEQWPVPVRSGRSSARGPRGSIHSSLSRSLPRSSSALSTPLRPWMAQTKQDQPWPEQAPTCRLPPGETNPERTTKKHKGCSPEGSFSALTLLTFGAESFFVVGPSCAL